MAWIGTTVKLSMGLVAAGSGVSRNRCDTRGEPAAESFVLVTENTTWAISPGPERSGDSIDWERILYERISAGRGDVYVSVRKPWRTISNKAVCTALSPRLRRICSYCDQGTDGGWTLVASSRGESPDDKESGYYEDLASLSPVVLIQASGTVCVDSTEISTFESHVDVN